MSRPVDCPTWWPLPAGEPIGEERAGEMMAYLQTVAPAAVARAREHLELHFPDVPISTYRVRTAQLATLALGEEQRGLSIGALSVPAPSGRYETVGIALQRDGRMALTIRFPGEQLLRWIAVG